MLTMRQRSGRACASFGVFAGSGSAFGLHGTSMMRERVMDGLRRRGSILVWGEQRSSDAACGGRSTVRSGGAEPDGRPAASGGGALASVPVERGGRSGAPV